MDLADLAQSGQFDDLGSGEIIEEKPIGGTEDIVLIKIRFLKEGVANNVRLCLSKAGLKTSVVFGGEMAGTISPDDYDRYFKLITSEGEFYRFSESVRRQLIDVFSL